MKPSRAMIPGEISWAFIALAFAWAGSGAWPLEPGPLYRMVAKHAHPWIWGALLGAPALVLMWVSAREWRAYCCRRVPRCWSLHELEASARRRGRLCLALLAGWLYMLKIAGGAIHGTSATAAVAAGGIAFMLWFYVENRRVQREIRVQNGSGVHAAG